jgi:hypothetical protein
VDAIIYEIDQHEWYKTIGVAHLGQSLQRRYWDFVL